MNNCVQLSALTFYFSHCINNVLSVARFNYVLLQLESVTVNILSRTRIVSSSLARPIVSLHTKGKYGNRNETTDYLRYMTVGSINSQSCTRCVRIWLPPMEKACDTNRIGRLRARPSILIPCFTAASNNRRMVIHVT